MKKINFLTSHFIPENTACTNRVLAFIRELEKTYKVNVICLTQKGEFQKNRKVSYSENIDIYYINQKEYDGKNFVLRAFKEIFYIGKLVWISRKIDHNLVIATSPYMFMIPLVGFGLRGPKVLDIRDLVWEYLDDKTWIKSIIKKTLRFIMRHGIKHFDNVVVTNDYEAKLLQSEYSVKSIDILFNGIEKNHYDKLTKIVLSNSMPFTVTYVGNMGLAQNIWTIIESAKQLPETRFLLLGTGVDLEEMKEYVDTNNITNVTLTGKVAWYKLKEYYEETSVLYAQLDEHYISAVPSKLYEYASVGLPIIYAGVGEAVKFIGKLENSIVIRPNRVEELVSAIIGLTEKNVTISKKNRLLVQESYLREGAAKDIVSIVDKLM